MLITHSDLFSFDFDRDRYLIQKQDVEAGFILGVIKESMLMKSKKGTLVVILV